MNNSILKNAFIEAELCEIEIIPHEFSNEFNNSIKRLIQLNSGALKLVNTAAKRAACIIMAIILSASTTVFSVKAIREPVIEAVQSVFVNIKKLLTENGNKNIAEYFTDDITEITAISGITTVSKEYKITDNQKIYSFCELLNNTSWSAVAKDYIEEEYYNYRFVLKSDGKAVTTVTLYTRFPENYGIAKIERDGKSEMFSITERAYLDLLAFTTEKYYLHKSDLPLPESEQCLKWQATALNGLTREEKQKFTQSFKYLHIHLEDFLLGNVSSLKEPDSYHWDRFNLKRDEAFCDPVTGVKSIDNTYYIILDCFDSSIDTVKSKELKETIKALRKDFVCAIESRSIGSVFALHEVIHDYDYYMINYPISFALEPPDWGGIDDYFGHLENLR